MFGRWSSPILLLLISVTVLVAKDYNGASCPRVTDCPPRASPCKTDDECTDDELCCDSPCGRPICVQRLYTGCQQIQSAARRRAKSLGDEGKTVRIPRCSKSGSFEPIQCDNEINSSCWCVDEEGFELAGTRAPAAGLVNCTAPKDCAHHTCRMLCPHGFALNTDGCPMCRCRDPCDEIKCPDSLSCHLEDAPCSDPPCPPVPSCKRGRSLENFCPLGDPLRIMESGLPFLCGTDPGKPNCPPLFQCLVKRGHDYGVCCPASLQIQKAGQCPIRADKNTCGPPCQHDLECHSIEKCCDSVECGKRCVHPQNLTECIHQRKLSDLLAINERAGKGYVPQCTETGQFEPKQCSRNGLVCWCVDKNGHKIQGTMSAAANVSCDVTPRNKDSGRSIDSNTLHCDKLECAAVCEYGFKLDEDGCPTCKCDNPCEGYTCGDTEECVAAKDASCSDFLCPQVPVYYDLCKGRPKVLYSNPCEEGAPLTNELTGTLVVCAVNDSKQSICPALYSCTRLPGIAYSVCCPETQTKQQSEIDETTTKINRHDVDDYQPTDEPRPQTMCEYLRDFSDSMEGTRDGMSLALPPPTCDDDNEGAYAPKQCYKNECWCVDGFGTEIPRTRGRNDSKEDCDKLRKTLTCLDLTCRMGCEYGFDFDEKTRCPKCQCRDPCSGVVCSDNEQCQLVEVSCKDYYCPPVPACLPRKTGQCPYLVPASSSFCDYECNSDLACNGTAKCCSNGCGTQCTEPLNLTACEHLRSVAQHQAHESATPLGKLYIPHCKPDGSFEDLQCDPSSQECWCVDFRGFELSSSRRPSSSKPSCSPPPKSNCPLYKCTQDCEHGFETDRNGCRTCHCIDPCEKVTCKGEGEMCRLVKVECATLPCPSVPMCLPEKENPCQHGSPLTTDGERVSCGPDFDACPTSHKCQLSPIGEYAVCCPKPRDVCFENKDSGSCGGKETQRNLTRWYFNSKTNNCETFSYTGCKGNHNNFHTDEICKKTCPVLSQCERLREKNQKAAEKYNKPTFNPRCEPGTGVWKAIQCLEHVGVCWCVTPQGEPVKGTLTRGSEPECNFRRARNRKNNLGETDIVFEEIIMQIGTIEQAFDLDGNEDEVVYWERPLRTRCQEMNAICDSQGKFNPKQCDGDACWCVDEAGNQLPHTDSFKDGKQICLPTPIDSVEVTLGFRGEFTMESAQPVINKIRSIVDKFKGKIVKNIIRAEPNADGLAVQFALEGNNKVDVAFWLEKMVTEQNILDLTADITRSQFVHRLREPQSVPTNRIIALEHREIIAQSPVSVVAPYHTALIVIAAASAFIISILTLLVILYRRKVSHMANADSNKNHDNKDFLAYTHPIYIELPKEKIPEETKKDVKT